MYNILIVDSAFASTDLMRQSLESTEYTVYTAESSYNALAKIQLFDLDVIILNAELPGISGYDLCKTIKSSEKTRDILVLFVVSIETKDSRLRALQVGADDFIEKTFDSYILKSKVKSLVRVRNLSRELKDKYAEIEEANRVLNLQLNMGKKVQLALIPDINIVFNNTKFISKYLPALDIGGDFYDVIKLNDHAYSVVLCDVSGHGISAALLTAMLKMMIKNLAAKYFNPDQLLHNLNNEFCRIFEGSNAEMYACIFYTVVDTKENKIYYSNAGQTMPLFFDYKLKQVKELDCGGLPIGMLPNSSYNFYSKTFMENDMIFYHTDGLMDIFFKDNPNEFSNKLSNVLLENSDIELEDILDIILNTFYNFDVDGNERYALDDISMILGRFGINSID